MNELYELLSENIVFVFSNSEAEYVATLNTRAFVFSSM